MAIIKSEESTQLDFGYGDINVAPGLLEHEELTGVVCFTHREPSPIGTHTDYEPHRVLEAADTPVRMMFTKIESIDVVIKVLEETKQLMINKETSGA